MQRFHAIVVLAMFATTHGAPTVATGDMAPTATFDVRLASLSQRLAALEKEKEATAAKPDPASPGKKAGLRYAAIRNDEELDTPVSKPDPASPGKKAGLRYAALNNNNNAATDISDVIRGDEP